MTPELAARALELSIDRCDFGDAVLFSDSSVAGRFRHHKIERLKSIADYSHFCLRVMPGLVETPFVLVIQWDGYVVDPSAWANVFKKYDYVGAVIHHKLGNFVGNGGFSLRSRKLLKALPALPLSGDLHEDEVIGRVFKKTLEQDFGIRFAPERIAERFSYEDHFPGRSTFGFHGPPNLWRHESDDEVMRVCRQLPVARFATSYFYGLIQNCVQFGRGALASRLYALAREAKSGDALKGAFLRAMPSPVVARTLDILEAGYSGR